MNAEDRLATLIRAAVEHEVMDAEPAPDLAARVVAGQVRDRRPVRWRMRLSFALVCAAVVAVVATVALLSAGNGDRTLDPEDYVVTTAFDPNKGVTIGYVPSGLVPSKPGAEFIKQPPVCPEKGKCKRPGYVVWQIQYETASPGKDRTAPHFQVRAVTGKVSLDSWRRPPADWRPAPVPSGRGLSATLGPADRSTHEIVVEPRKGLLVIVDAVAMPGGEVLKIAQGITVTV